MIGGKDDNYLYELFKEEHQNELIAISDIDITASEEAEITLENVKVWYFATENIARVVANTLQTLTVQTVNQLRYAGHHVLKYQTTTNENEKQANLIEAYKHCKRGYFDALDLFVYETNRTFQGRLLSLEKKEDIKKYTSKLAEVINDINSARLSSSSRIDYYQGVQNKIHEMQNIFAEINSLTQNQSKEIYNLRLDNNHLKNALEAANADLKNNRTNIIVSLFAAAATALIALATLYQGYLTAKDLTPESKHYQYIYPQEKEKNNEVPTAPPSKTATPASPTT